MHIIDSYLSHNEAVSQNPESICPQDILQDQRLLEVEYFGFDSSLHLGQIVVAESVASDVEAFFEEALRIKFSIAKVIPAADPRYRWDDEKLMSDNVSSGFNYRLIAGTEKPSKHALGLAFDINPVQNPYIRYKNGHKIVQPPRAKWGMARPGTLYAGHSLVKFMAGLGWEWGGNWTPESGRTDYQHFQKNS